MGVKNDVFKQKIIKELFYNQSLSASDLSLKIDKSLPITTKIIAELIADRYVMETGYAPSTGGRRPLLYTIQPEVIYTVSVAMDQFVTRIAIMDMNNQFVTPVEKFGLPLAKNPDAVSILVNKIEEVINRSGIEKSKIAGVGIGMPGFIDVKKGINYTFLPTRGKSITSLMSEELKLPVFIDNDSSLIALAELRFGVAKKYKNAMVINIGWGIGLGMIINGELFRGQNGFAGEFSHIPIFSNGKLCTCGKTGCLETETSLQVVVEKAIRGLAEGRLSSLTGKSLENLETASEEIIEAAYEGDRFAVELLSEAAYHIGRGVAILIHLVNPEAIILSGRGAIAGKIFQAPIQQALNEHCIPRLAANTSIEVSAFRYDAEMIGAAALVMENFDDVHMDGEKEASPQLSLNR